MWVELSIHMKNTMLIKDGVDKKEGRSKNLVPSIYSRADSRFVPSQWETSLQSNAVSHRLNAIIESTLYSQYPTGWATGEAVPDYQLVWPRRHPWFNWCVTAYPSNDAGVNLRRSKHANRGALQVRGHQISWWRHQMETFSALLALCAGNIPPHKGQWRGALMFTLVCARINGWVNNREAGDLRRNRALYDVSLM